LAGEAGQIFLPTGLSREMFLAEAVELRLRSVIGWFFAPVKSRQLSTTSAAEARVAWA
jgi:hypothetical protein